MLLLILKYFYNKSNRLITYIKKIIPINADWFQTILLRINVCLKCHYIILINIQYFVVQNINFKIFEFLLFTSDINNKCLLSMHSLPVYWIILIYFKILKPCIIWINILYLCKSIPNTWNVCTIIKLKYLITLFNKPFN